MRISTALATAGPITTIVPIQQVDSKADQEALAALPNSWQLPDIDSLFSAEHGEHLLHLQQQERILLLGVGKNWHFNKVLRAFRQLAIKQAKLLSADVRVHWPQNLWGTELHSCCEAATNGLCQGQYTIAKYKTQAPEAHILSNATVVHTVAEEEQIACQTAATRGLAIGKSQLGIMDLVNAPSNKKTPQDLAKWAEQSAQQHGYQAEIWDKAKVTEAGMEALLAVGQGSPTPPCFILLRYEGPDCADKPLVGLVGKGVTFDTGGLSIKPSTNMHYMKSDMGGAAAVLGTVEAAARMELPVRLVAAIPCTDNSVDADAVKPSDVIGSYSGKTIEIIDTDAEGRLILADGLSYIARNYKPDVLINLATLTGSSVRTFGYQAAALFSVDDALAQQLKSVGSTNGERVWQLPLWEEYGEQMQSDVADIKNFSGRPMAGAITAAKFLQFFTDEHPHWAHLDIAGVAFGDTDFAKGKAATGYGVQLLVDYLEQL